MLTSVWFYVHVGVKPALLTFMGLDLLELKWPAVGRHLMWVLGSHKGFSLLNQPSGSWPSFLFQGLRFNLLFTSAWRGLSYSASVLEWTYQRFPSSRKHFVFLLFFSFFFDYFIDNLFDYVWIFCLYVCMHHVHALMPKEVRREH